MSAALHLAEVHQAPPGPKRKRKGGGGDGGEFYEYAQRIYSDDRAGSKARELLLAFAYAVTTAPPDDGDTQWALLGEALGQNSRVEELIHEDVPRYVSPMHKPSGYDNLLRICSAPRLRPYKSHSWPGSLLEEVESQEKRDADDFRNRFKICGAKAADYAIELMPGTGWHKIHYFCPAHRGNLAQVREQIAEQNEAAPKPIPNAGGLLPSYFDADWEKVYRHYANPRWEPPVYGLRADDWPIPGREPVAPRARLRLAALDGELLGGTQ